MKPKEKKPETVYRIINRKTGEPEGSYSRACCDEYDFESINSARTANCHGVFEDRAKYNIAEYRVTYELINDNVDPPTSTELEKHKKDKEIENEMDKLGLSGLDRVMHRISNRIDHKQETE